MSTLQILNVVFVAVAGFIIGSLAGAGVFDLGLWLSGRLTITETVTRYPLLGAAILLYAQAGVLSLAGHFYTHWILNH